MLPEKAVTAPASFSWTLAFAASRRLRSRKAAMFRDRAEFNPVGCGGATVGEVGRLWSILASGGFAMAHRAPGLNARDRLGTHAVHIPRATGPRRHSRVDFSPPIQQVPP